MNVEQIETIILALPPTEHGQLITRLDAHRHELVEMSVGVRAELELRLEETDDCPDLLEEFDEKDLERMFKDFAEACPQRPAVNQNRSTVRG